MMTIGGQLKSWGKKNIADSNSQNYLERKVELCIEIIERELYKQFKNVGIEIPQTMFTRRVF